jgi:hypothetical protein
MSLSKPGTELRCTMTLAIAVSGSMSSHSSRAWLTICAFFADSVALSASLMLSVGSNIGLACSSSM